MLGTGLLRGRKLHGCVPHDLGSPTESPWRRVNAYNFQDVGAWRDLGPKFVLQVYRNYLHAVGNINSNANTSSSASARPGPGPDIAQTPAAALSVRIAPGSGLGLGPRFGPDAAALQLLRELYPCCRHCMHKTDAFDLDGDGVIENSSAPDQTYDIWTCSGISAYCGGLYVTACRAMTAMAALVGDTTGERLYSARSRAGQRAYLAALWTGSYLRYDSSASAHSDSVMADMCCGQWWARVCGLEALLTPAMALSCYRTIFRLNVQRFAAIRAREAEASAGGRRGGRDTWLTASYSFLRDASLQTTIASADLILTTRDSLPLYSFPPDPCLSDSSAPPLAAPDCPNPLCGAVNGMRPDGQIDQACLQSREVWTGTTYALAAAMLCEARHDYRGEGGGEGGGGGGVGGGKLREGLEAVSPQSVAAWLDESPLPEAPDAATATATATSGTATATFAHPSHSLTPVERAELQQMAHLTAQGVHDAGWGEFGYWFATPEAWDAQGNYRSLGYMRPLCVWAMQYADQS